MNSRVKVFIIIGAVFLLNGCAMIPKYTRPKMPVPAELPTGTAYENSMVEQDALFAADIRWQAAFPDKKLQQIIESSLVNNRDLKLASLNVERARAMYGIQRANLLPAVSLIGAGSKYGVPAGLSSTGSAMTVEEYSVDLGIVSWEIDIFGRIRSMKEQALQEYLGSEQVRRGVQTVLISEVARAYLTLAADRENLKLAQSTHDGQQKIYNMIKEQYDHGVVNALDLRRSQSQVDTARGDIARYTQLVALDQNALNLLAGSQVPEDILPPDLASVIPPMDISAGLSSEVLLRRPDIMAAENELKAANAYIGAARAAFFPSISLTTAIGTASSNLSGLFDHGTRAWSFAPQASMPIFDARTWAAFKVSQAQKDIAVARYEKIIQAAFREVSDVLAVRGTMDDQVAAQESIVDSEKKVYELSGQRYVQGVDDYLSVLDAQRSLYAAQQKLTSLRLARLANQAKLFAVLGGEL